MLAALSVPARFSRGQDAGSNAEAAKLLQLQRAAAAEDAAAKDKQLAELEAKLKAAEKALRTQKEASEKAQKEAADKADKALASAKKDLAAARADVTKLEARAAVDQTTIADLRRLLDDLRKELEELKRHVEEVMAHKAASEEADLKRVADLREVRVVKHVVVGRRRLCLRLTD